QTLNLWDPTTLQRLRDHPGIPSELLTDNCSIAISPLMNRIAVATRSGSIRLLGLEGRLLFSLAGLPAELQAVQFSPDGKRLAVAEAGSGLRVWDLEKREVLVTMPKSSAEVSCGPCFTTNGGMVTVGNDDGTVEVWSLATKGLVGNWKAHKSAVSGVGLVP